MIKKFLFTAETQRRRGLFISPRLCASAVQSIVLLLVALAPAPSFAQTPGPTPKYGLPFATEPSASTWQLGQFYGNTTGAFARRVEWYSAGQGIHFGIDFSAKCGTQVVSIGDGVVVGVDNMAHGSAPHNVIISHPEGYTSLYGHLLQRSTLRVGQAVKKGDPIGLTGDPDLTCTSRPHLHLEIRSKDMSRAYNAHTLIDADWDALMLVGAFGRGFQRDLDDPRKWQSVYDQPSIQFGGPFINTFKNNWPQDWK